MSEKILAEQIDLSGIDVIFEITRFCNMLCPHCIRGDRQKLRIKKEFIDKIFEQINYIGTLTVSGGEPSLANDIMGYILESASFNGVNIGNFWMATNGSNVKPSFLKNLEKFYGFCSDNEVSGLRVSIDNYHDDIGYNEEVFKEFEEKIKYEYGISNFYVELQGAPNDSENLISEGRAKDNYYCTREIKHEIFLEKNEYEGEVTYRVVEGNLYVNAKGFIISTCNISYNTEDNNKDFTICHVTDNIKEKLAEFFNNHPEQIYNNGD